MMNKKIASEIAIGIILLVVLVLGSAFWIQNKKIVEETTILPVSQQNKTMENAQQVIQENNVSEESELSADTYQKVEINNPQLKFSFEVPDFWVVEKRNSGEKEMTLDEKKDFLADVLNGDSEGADYTRDDFNKMSAKEIEDFFPMKIIASVAQSDHIFYTDIMWNQIDFIIQNSREATEEIASWKKSLLGGGCFSAYTDKEIGKNIFKNIKVNEMNAVALQYPTDIDDNGEETSTKGCNGGQYIFIKIPNIDKTLKIVKQSKGDDQYEKDFQHLLETLKIEKSTI